MKDAYLAQCLYEPRPDSGVRLPLSREDVVGIEAAEI